MIKLKLRILLNNILIGLLLIFHIPSFIIFVILGTVHVYKQKDPNYVDEFVFRYNTRTYSESYRFDAMLNNINTHLTYKELINARDNRKMEAKQGTLGI